MNNFLSPLLFFLSFAFIVLYVVFKFKVNKEFSFARDFPFESNKSAFAIRTSFLLIFLSSICSIFFYLNVYFNTFSNSYIFIAALAAVLICVLFLMLNFINLVNLRLHFIVFSLFAALITAESIDLGFHAINAYKIDSDSNWLFILIAVMHFAKALFELILVSPLFKFSFLMEVNVDDGTMKRPKFIRLAFYEWLYLLFFILNGFLLLITRMI